MPDNKYEIVGDVRDHPKVKELTFFIERWISDLTKHGFSLEQCKTALYEIHAIAEPLRKRQ